MEPKSAPDFEILTSIRSDKILTQSALNAQLSASGQPSQFYMLRYHRDRMLAAAEHFGWEEAIRTLTGPVAPVMLEKFLLEHLDDTYGNPNHPSPLKIRILLGPFGQLTTTSTPTPSLPLSVLFPTTLPTRPESPAWRIFVSPHASTPTPHTTHKTTLRDAYTRARSLLPTASPLPAEILLVNADGEIMEGTLTTPYFWRDGSWVTPLASAGGNVGTTRRWALQRRLCEEGSVRSVELGEVVWLSNGVRGWGWGRVEELAWDS